MTRNRRWLNVAGLAAVVVLLALAASVTPPASKPTASQTSASQTSDNSQPSEGEIERLEARIAEQEQLIADRDELIANQESLLNDYRCMFNVDTQVVPGGCSGSTQPTPTATAAPTGAAAVPDGTTAEQWAQLRQCNSDGSYQYSNPNGTNFGAYEFKQATWDELARQHYPHLEGVNPRDAAAADQDRMAYALYEERGWQPWPACATALSSGAGLPPIPAGTTAEQWDQLIACESNGNYRAYNPAGPYLGAFQFNQPTWDGVASRHKPELVGVDPRDAAPEDQHLMAYALYVERGWQPWPVCGAAKFGQR